MLTELFPESVEVIRGVAEDARVPWDAVPAKGAVYLLVGSEESGSEEKPLLLATVGDLRAAIRRRLADAEPDVKTRRVDYAKVCTRLCWRRVDSSFSANWWYWKTARALFPQTYAALVPWRSSWWIGVERDGAFPRMRRTTNLSDATMLYAGPVRDKQSAGKLIEAVEDLFDLCRYHAELVQAPRGKACAYKEMGKCPAPCDGSVELPWYRRQMTTAWSFLTGDARAQWKTAVEADMRAAAGRHEFEAAGRIKQRLVRAAALEGEAFRWVRGLEKFSFVALQPGKGKPWVEPWIIHGGRVECLAQVGKKELATGMEQVAARYRELAGTPIGPSINVAGMEQMAIAAHHLFRGEDDHGIWVEGSEILNGGGARLVVAAEALFARKAVMKPLVEQSCESDVAAL